MIDGDSRRRRRNEQRCLSRSFVRSYDNVEGSFLERESPGTLKPNVGT